MDNIKEKIKKIGRKWFYDSHSFDSYFLARQFRDSQLKKSSI